MKPAAFDYERPSSVQDAVKLLADESLFAKVIAGSQSLGPMLNLRLAQPDLLVDITSIRDLRAVIDGRDDVEIGACVTHADIEDGRVADVTCGLLPFVASRIAYRAVRNRGTVGGSLAHADPASDWVAVFPLLGAEVVVEGRAGRRSIPAESLMISSFITGLKADEVLCGVRVAKLSAASRWGYSKFNQKVGEYAHALGAILHDPARERFRAVIGAVESAPIVVADATSLFGGPFGLDLADRMDEKAVGALLSERGITDVYSRKQAVVALRRAAQQASQ